MLAALPYGLSWMNVMAWSSDSAGMIARTGPKISSRASPIAGRTLSKMVGWR
jgi:hypothetical protein